MAFYLNLVFAWICMIIAGIMAVIYFLRIMNKQRRRRWIAAINRALRQNHKSLGIILIVLGLVHGIMSSDKAIGFNLGTLSWVLSILLGLSFVYRKRFKPQRIWMTLHRFLTIAFAALIAVHVINVGGFSIDDVLLSGKAYAAAYTAPSPSLSNTVIYESTPTATQTPTPQYSQPTDPETVITPTAPAEPTATPTPSKYIDGTYQGVADGFRPGLTVEVEIKNDVIISVEVISHNEVRERFWGYPVENIPLWIVEAQSTDVDTVSGATYTSRGIIAAVDDALAKALR